MLDAAIFVMCLTQGMDVGLAMSIAEQESSGKPYAFNVNRWEGETIPMISMESSIDLSKRFVDKGYSVDVGLMGINSKNIDRLGQSIETTFDPCTNIAMGETIYTEFLEKAKVSGFVGHEAIRVALSQYNTGSMTRGFTNGYVDKVWERYMKKSSYQARVADINVPWERSLSWSEQITKSRVQWGRSDE